MAGKAIYLSDNDAKLLRDLIARERQRYGGPTPLRSAELIIPNAPETYIAFPDDTIEALSDATAYTGTSPAEYDVPGYGIATIYQIVHDYVADPSLHTIDSKAYVYNLSKSEISRDWVLVTRDKMGHWIAIPTATSELVECSLIEDHPGRGVPFSVYVGTWNPATNRWDYDCGWETGTGMFTGTGTAALTATAIDWRYASSDIYPEAGARGLFIKRSSDIYGYIYECVSMDCDSPCALGGEPCCPTTGTAV